MKLVEKATCSGRMVELTTYIEGGKYPVVASLICHSWEQARDLAAELNKLAEKQCEPLDRKF